MSMPLGRLQGVIVPLITPLTPSDEVDVAGLRSLVRHVLRGGVSGIFVLGSSGELANLTPDERRLVVEVAVEENAGRVPIFAGNSAPGIKEVFANAAIAAEAGADAVVVTPPFYYHYNQREIIGFFTRVANESALPVILYDVPSRTGTKLSVDAILELSENERIAALKDTTGDFARFIELIEAFESRDGLALFQGDERLMAASVLLGADGAVLGLANVHPSLCVRVYEAAAAGDIGRAKRLQKELNELFNVFRAADSKLSSFGAVMGGLKTALDLLGICGGKVCSPSEPLTDEQRANVLRVLDGVGLGKDRATAGVVGKISASFGVD